jgi:hypothetical protein
MWLRSLIADMRKAVADDPATAQAVFAALGTLVSVAEADARTQTVSVRGDEPPAPGGPAEPRSPDGSRWLRRGRSRPALTGSGLSSPAAGSTRLSQPPPGSAGVRLWPELEDDVDRGLGDLAEPAEAGVLGQPPYHGRPGLGA